MKKVIIIGAGPAGITAGYELLKQSNEYEVTILEESPYVGGISRTEVYNGHRMDIGGHRFFSKSQEVNDWWEQIMPIQGAPAYDDDKLGRSVPLEKGGPDPAKVDRVMLNRSRISHIYYKRKFFEYPVRMNMDTVKNMGFGTTMQAGFSYLGSMVAKKPENSLENFYINQFGKKLYSMFFEGYTEKLWGRHPREIDPSWGAQRTKGLSITEIVKDATRKAFHKESKDVNTSLIGAFKYPKLGPGQLWEAAAADFEAMGGSIHYNCRVIRINTSGNQVDSVTCAVDGITIEEKADIIISSMPIKDLIIGMSNVPNNVNEVARKLPYRDFVTVGLLVPKLRINNTTYMKTLGNVIPDTWIYVQDPGIKMGRIQIFNNWSPYLLENPEKTVWVGLEYFCNEGDRYWNMTDEEWIQFATKELVHMGILSESTKVIDAHKVAVKKAYPAYFDTYSRFEEVRTYLDSFENLYCVGRNGQHRYNNMDHSMMTSFETVKNIINGVKDKSNIWNVNIEKEYHEEKKAPAEAKVVEEKVVITAAPVPPVKEEKKNVPTEEAPAPEAAATTVKQEPPVKKEEEIQAMVQAVPAPPVRKQMRRKPVPKAISESDSVEVSTSAADTLATAASVVAVAETVAQSAESNTVSVKASEVAVVPEVTEVHEPEIHVWKSRSIWEDVEYAEATAEVKTAPIRFKSVEEAHAAVKGNNSLKKEEDKKQAKKQEVASEEEKTVTEEKKATRGRKKKAEPKTEEVAEIKTEESELPKAEEVAETVTDDSKVEKTDEVPVAEEKKATRGRKKKAETKPEEITEVKTDAPAEVAEEKPATEAKKATRGRRKKIVEEPKEEAVEEVVAEEAKAENVEETVAEEPKAETVEETVAEEPKAEAVEETAAEEPKAEAVEETVVEEPKKEVAEEIVAEKTSHARTTSGKTIAGRSASHRSSANRHSSNRRKVEPEHKKVSTVGKEATVGNMKGTVIKSNVIEKMPNDGSAGYQKKTNR